MRRNRIPRRGQPSLKKLIGVGGLDNDTYAGTDIIVPGVVGGFYFATIARFGTIANNNYLVQSLDVANGYALYVLNGELKFLAADGVGTHVVSPGYALTAGHVFSYVAVWDGTKIRAYANGAQVADGTAMTGYTASPNAAYIGAPGASNGYLTSFGLAYGAGAPSAANIAAWAGMCRAGRYLYDMPGTPAAHIWRPNTDATFRVSVGTTGGSAINLTGTGFTAVSDAAPVWG